ncbi:MAG: hypothetical protein NTY19_51490 [Planctomycetota bacterium]|nr:hypothetical protein [Planctomycetota bacterium]
MAANPAASRSERKVLASWILVALLAAAARADNRVEIRTLARPGGTAITEVVAEGNTDLQVQNQAARGGTSRLVIDAAAADGGVIRGRFFAASRGGNQESRFTLRAVGPGAEIDLQDVSVNKAGTINNDARLVVEGDSRLHWRSQQRAESGGVARTRHDVELRAAPGSHNVVDVEVLTDGVRHEATNTLRLRAVGNASVYLFYNGGIRVVSSVGASRPPA